MHMSIFHPLKVVGHGSETDLKVGENLKQITWWEKVKQRKPHILIENNV